MRIYYPQDMTGKIFGKWTILERKGQKSRGNYSWLSRCECGTTKEVDGNSLRLGRSLCCHKCSLEINLTGKKFNFLTAISPIKEKENGPTNWLFKCECGTFKKIRGDAVTSGSTKSCGCKQGLWSGLTDEQRMFNRICANYRYGAKSRKKVFELTIEEVSFLIKQPCTYCGNTDSNCLTANRKNKYKFYYNGIDRLDSSIGYIKDNCVSCCGLCNKMKMILDAKEFLNHITRIVEFQRSKSK